MEVIFIEHTIIKKDVLLLFLGKPQKELVEYLKFILNKIPSVNNTDKRLEEALSKLRRLKLPSPKESVPEEPETQENFDECSDDENEKGFKSIKPKTQENSDLSAQISKIIASDLGILSIDEKDLEELVDILAEIGAD